MQSAVRGRLRTPPLNFLAKQRETYTNGPTNGLSDKSRKVPLPLREGLGEGYVKSSPLTCKN